MAKTLSAKPKKKVQKSGIVYRKCTNCGDPCLEMTVEEALSYAEFMFFGGSPIYCYLCRTQA